MTVSRLAWIVLASVAGLLVAGLVTYFAVNAGNSPGEQAGIAPPTATTPAATQPPTETAPAPTETFAPPSSSPTATFDSELPPDLPPVYCDPRRSHLNIEKLRARPNLTGAVITEVDANTVSIELDGVQMFVSGWGGVVMFNSNGASDQVFEQVAVAVNAVAFEC